MPEFISPGSQDRCVPLTMHFSPGQITFLIIFVATFTIALVWAYRRDRPENKKYYRGAWKVLITLVIVIAAISYILKNLRVN
jgi:hypothetical protein